MLSICTYHEECPFDVFCHFRMHAAEYKFHGDIHICLHEMMSPVLWLVDAVSDLIQEIQ